MSQVYRWAGPDRSLALRSGGRESECNSVVPGAWGVSNDPAAISCPQTLAWPHRMQTLTRCQTGTPLRQQAAARPSRPQALATAAQPHRQAAWPQLLVAAGAASLLLLGGGAPAEAAARRPPPVQEEAGRCDVSALDKFAGKRAAREQAGAEVGAAIK